MPNDVKPDRAAWTVVALLCLASLLFSRAFACAMPFAALAAFGARALPARAAVTLVLAAWLGNQGVGFGLLHYPWTASTFGWGLAIGVAALAASAAARVASHAFSTTSPAGWAGVLFAGFGAYEAVLRAAAFLLPSGADAFAPATVLRILAVNAVALGLMVAAGVLASAIAPQASRSRLPFAGA